MRVIRPEANNVAGVILTSPKLMFYEDMWRHKKDVLVEVTLNTYIDFLAGNTNLLRYFSLQDMELIEKYRLNANNRSILSKVYPLYVRDILRAYVNEIVYAAKKESEVTKIIYVPPTPNYKKINAEKLKNVIELKQLGREYLLREESKGYMPHISAFDDQYLIILNLCMITIGYTFFAEENPMKFSWVLL